MALYDLVPGRKSRRDSLVRAEDLSNPFDALERQMHRLLGDFFGGGSLLPERDWARAGIDFVPRMEVSESDKEVLVTAEIPGIDEKDIEISAADGVLTVRGEKKQQTEEKKEGLAYSERSYGSFSRSISLPAEIDEQKAQASYRNGVLQIRLPKTEPQKPRTRKIPIQTQ